MNLLLSLVIFSSVSFLFFGISCLLAPQMKTEFVRYGLGKWRFSVGILQLTGATGLTIGYFYFPILSIISATGLSLLMILGFGVRLKIKDSFLQSAPSFIFAAVNIYLTIALLKHLELL